MLAYLNSSVLTRVPTSGLLFVFKLLSKLYPSHSTEPIMKRASELAFGSGSAFIELYKRVMRQCAPKVRKKFISNIIIKWRATEGHAKRMAFREQHGFAPPMFFVISPTMRCNLRCTGCYSGMYAKDGDLPIELVDKAIEEGKEIGMRFFTISGGEPFIRDDLLDLYERHGDSFFQVYTNGYFLDKKMARRLAELGNVSPAISVEGYGTQTDERRGKGTQERVERAMDNLREAGVLFGFSATPTRHNSDIMATEEFFDYYIDKGCFFGWLFQYLPLGVKPDISLMSTPEQRNKLREMVWEVRRTRPVFLGDFWNDGPLVGGCMAGGRLYFHINVHGDIEPCVFQHFSVDNIRNTSITEALSSGYFKAIREEQPRFRDNWYTPCMIIDRPGVLRDIVSRTGAKPSYDGSDSLVTDEEITKGLDEYAERMEYLSRPCWESRYGDLS